MKFIYPLVVLTLSVGSTYIIMKPILEEIHKNPELLKAFQKQDGKLKEGTPIEKTTEQNKEETKS